MYAVLVAVHHNNSRSSFAASTVQQLPQLMCMIISTSKRHCEAEAAWSPNKAHTECPENVQCLVFLWYFTDNSISISISLPAPTHKRGPHSLKRLTEIDCRSSSSSTHCDEMEMRFSTAQHSRWTSELSWVLGGALCGQTLSVELVQATTTPAATATAAATRRKKKRQSVSGFERNRLLL